MIYTDIYSKEEYEKDTVLIDRLEEEYKAEKDTYERASKRVYYNYLYEARRFKLLGSMFKDGIENWTQEFLDEQRDHLYDGHILGAIDDEPFYVKDWVKEAEKKFGYEPWEKGMTESEEVK